MVHIPSSYRYDFWLQQSCDQLIEINCLLPNGVFIPLEVNKDATLHEIKEDLWEEATKYPLVCKLQDSSSYIFSCVNGLAERERLIDEAKRLCDVRPFNSVLKVVERSQESDENKVLQQHISHLIGRGLHEFDELKNPEVNYFRWKMKLLADEVAAQRLSKSWLERLCCQFPPRLAPQTNLPPTVTTKLKDGNLLIYIIFKPNHSNQYETKKMSVSHRTKPSELVSLALLKFLKNQPPGRENSIQHCLKVKGQEEYLVGNNSIVSFVYIQESLANDTEPSLVVVPMESIPVDGTYLSVRPNNADELKDSGNSFSTLTLRKKGKLTSSWQIDQPFAFQVSAVARLNCDVADNRTVDVCVQAGLFHSGKALCESQKSNEKTVNKDGTVVWDEDLQFDIKVSNIPRMARLCIVLFEVSKSSKGLKSKKIKDQKQEMYINPIGWVNTPVFDFKNQLKTGAMTLYMWSYAEDSQTDSDLFHPLGTVTSNPNVDHSTTLTILFHKYHAENTVIYPPLEKILETSKQKNSDKNIESIRTSSSSFEQIKALAERDPLHEMHEQEKKDVWANRYVILREVPEMLPKLLDCVEWNNHNEICEAIALLDKWPLLPPEKALELLDYAYADQAVRSFAVKCLSKVTDDDLSLFLLQLVQALKHENYLHCDLVEFLLRRALNNQKIGHFLFWHLRSEMHVPSVWVRFGLMLEAYCRGDVDHMRMLCRQVTLLSKLKSFAEEVRLKRDKDKARHWLHETLAQVHITEYLDGVLNPLDPTYRFKNVRVERCKVMDSKMRPLWLVMENSDTLGDDVYLLFKNGDDLRQDMLTLQMIRLMDRLWKNEGLDLRMNPYGCISTDNRVGLIEVVLNAETIANIQKEKGMSVTSAFKKGSLLAWLKDHNPSEVSLNKAIEEFTYSCAGYCVATYVLGVADRHSDNIMVKRTGQLFHIDFGHILGHFKEKFGFRRERVPFVLTHDFVHVINKGQTVKKERGNQPKKFEVFQKRCEDAFLILRKHGNLILSLFAMMISTGLPELSSEQDLSYLRETLVLDLSEADARAHFRSKFDEALSNSWKTSIHWASHNMAKNNRV